MSFASDQGRHPKAYPTGTVRMADAEMEQKTPANVYCLDAIQYYALM